MAARSLWLLAAAALVLAITVFTTRGTPVDGDADERAQALATTLAPGYEPWVAPVLTPDDAQEALLFRLQTATGLLLFAAVVVVAGRRARQSASHAPAPPR